MHVVKENGDGTVTIDREVYEDLRRRACANKTEHVPLTPDIRAAVNTSMGDRIAALNKLESTPWVNLMRVACEASRTVINALPDGYPMPVTRGGRRGYQ